MYGISCIARFNPLKPGESKESQRKSGVGPKLLGWISIEMELTCKKLGPNHKKKIVFNI